MKILQLCLSDGKGGLELYALKLMKWLHENEMDSHAVVLPESFFAQNLDAENIPYTGLTNTFRYLPLLSARRLARLVEEEKIDILHMHWGKDLALAAMAKRFSRRPVKLIYTRHMEIAASKKDFYHKALYGAVDVFIGITKESQRKAIECLPMDRQKIKLLYHGVPEAEPSNSQACSSFFNMAGLKGHSFKIALFGRIEHSKGQHFLVEAVEKLVHEGLDVEALLIGHVMDANYLKRVMTMIDEKGLTERIRYYGFHQKSMEVMGCFDAVVLTSFNETFGLVLIEAMRAGTAVIGTRAGGVPEIIEEGRTGLMFSPGDSADLAEALGRLVRDPSLCRKMAETGKCYADEQFSEEGHFEGLTQIYKSLA